MKTAYRIATLTLLAGGLHLALGWEWTLLAGLAAGYVAPLHGWLVGAVVVALDYLVLVLYSYAYNPYAVKAMTEATGGILGNLPSPAVVALTVSIGVLIGTLGGAAGSRLRDVMDRRREPAEAAVH